MGGEVVRPQSEVTNLLNSIEKSIENSLDVVDTILKKFPQYGETLTTLGLSLYGLNHKSEAYEVVHISITKDISNSVHWCVYALLHWLDRQYRDAFKCQKHAMRIDYTNSDVLLDLSMMQVDVWHSQGFIETQRILLLVNPTFRTNWICYAVAHHFTEQVSKAIYFLETYEKALEDQYPLESERYEHGEMLLYKISLLEAGGYLTKALEELHKSEGKIPNKLGFLEQLASVSLALGHFEEGEKAYRTLLSMNPENHKYFTGLQKCLQLYSEGEYECDKIEALDALYKSLRDKYNTSTAVQRIPLDFLEGDKFREAADNYVRPLLSKGVLSLYFDLVPLLNKDEKASILEQLFLTLEQSIRLTGCFPGSSKKEPPWTLMRILQFLSELYCRKVQHHIALRVIDEAITHTPTEIDLYIIKAKILVSAGDLPAAASLTNEARSMDPTCPFINSCCISQMLRADQVEMGEKIAASFTNQQAASQNIWYDLTVGECYLQQDCIGSALKKFLAIEKYFLDTSLENRIAMNSRCQRNIITPQTYLSMLNFERLLYSDYLFTRAAEGIIRCYVKLHDSLSKFTEEEGDEISGNSRSKKKKKRGKQKKTVRRTKNEGTPSGEGPSISPADLDPSGEIQSQVEDPLQEATTYLWVLHLHAPRSVQTHVLSFDVYLRKKKLLLAYRALEFMYSVDKNDPDCHRCSIKFFQRIQGFTPTRKAERIVKKVLETVADVAIRDVNTQYLMTANSNFLWKNIGSLMHRAAAAEMLYLVVPARKQDAIRMIEDSRNNIIPEEEWSGGVGEWLLADCVAVHKLFVTVFNDEDAASRWRARCIEYFPYSSYFEGPRSSVAQGPSQDVAAVPEERP